MTMTMAKEFAPRGITVNAVAPGFIASDMTSELPEAIVEGVSAPEEECECVCFEDHSSFACRALRTCSQKRAD